MSSYRSRATRTCLHWVTATTSQSLARRLTWHVSWVYSGRRTYVRTGTWTGHNAFRCLDCTRTTLSQFSAGASMCSWSVSVSLQCGTRLTAREFPAWSTPVLQPDILVIKGMHASNVQCPSGATTALQACSWARPISYRCPACSHAVEQGKLIASSLRVLIAGKPGGLQKYKPMDALFVSLGRGEAIGLRVELTQLPYAVVCIMSMRPARHNPSVQHVRFPKHVRGTHLYTCNDGVPHADR